MLRLLLLTCLLAPLCLFAQQEGERFWSGHLTYNTTNTQSFRNGTSTGNSGYYIDLRISKGKFISNNRMVYGGLVSTINYTEGFGRSTGRYTVGAQIGLGKYYPLFAGLYASLNHDITYLYGWNGARSRVHSHYVNYRFSPGLMYRMGPRFALQLNLSLLSIGVTRQYDSNRSQSQSIALNILSGTSLSNLNFGLYYFPFQAQRKKH